MIILQVVDSNSGGFDHLHSIVIKVDDLSGNFDIHNLLQTLAKMSMEVL